jgi:exopolysaccharide production protein ExoY
MDVLGAAVLLILLSPVFLVVAVLVRATSPGPVFFRHERLGMHGRPFRVLKFRSMYTGARLSAAERAVFESRFKLANDPRVTPVGRVLRKLSLDELPQLVNVLRGEMSLVGPRPIVRDELDQLYGEAGALLLTVRPGLTGLWQVSGRSTLSYERRIALDLEYVERHSLLFDLALIARTPWVVLRGRGAV